MQGATERQFFDLGGFYIFVGRPRLKGGEACPFVGVDIRQISKALIGLRPASPFSGCRPASPYRHGCLHLRPPGIDLWRMRPPPPPPKRPWNRLRAFRGCALLSQLLTSRSSASRLRGVLPKGRTVRHAALDKRQKEAKSMDLDPLVVAKLCTCSSKRLRGKHRSSSPSKGG